MLSSEKKYLVYQVSSSYSRKTKEIEVQTVDQKGEFILAKGTPREIKNYFHPRKIVSLKNNLPIIDRIQISLTENCNLNCLHCYVGKKKRHSLFVYSSLVKLFDSFQELGVKIIEYSGGEPTIHPDFIKIIQLGRQKGFYQVLLTNGFWSTEQQKKLIPKIVELIDKVRISIDGPEHLHNQIRGYSQAFQKSIQALKFLGRLKTEKRTNFQLEVGLTIIPQTRILDLVQLFLAIKDYIDRFFISPVVPEGESCYISSEELKEVYERMLDFLHLFRFSEVNRFYQWTKKVYPNKPVKFSCDAGRSIIYFTSEGDIYPCPLLVNSSLKIGSINFQKSISLQIKEAQENFKKSGWFKKAKKFQSVCAHCSQRCFYPCPAYRFYLGRNSNPWCLFLNNFFRLSNSPFYFLIEKAKGNRKEEAKLIQETISQLKIKKGKIIDLGCGSGKFLNLLSQMIVSQKSFLGIDKSSYLINHALKRYQDNNRIQFKKIDCFQEKWAKDVIAKYGQFDFAFNIWTSILGYEGGYYDRIFFKNIYQILKSNGYLLIDTNNLNVLQKNFQRKSKMKVKKGKHEFVLVEHRELIGCEKNKILTFFDIYKDSQLVFSTNWLIKLYSLDDLNKLFLATGFKIVKSDIGKRLQVLVQKA